MPPVKKDTTPAEGAIRPVVSVRFSGTDTEDATGKPAPKQQDAQVEHACAWWLPFWRLPPW